MITEKDLLELKRKAEDGKQRFTQAQATMIEVQRNIEQYRDDLRELGVDPDHAEEKLADLEQEIKTAYEEIRSKLPN